VATFPWLGPQPSATRETESSEAATQAEGRLDAEADELKQQAEQSRSPEEGENLLRQ
jgi:hypothetical protein